jgi:hypothetical protein
MDRSGVPVQLEIEVKESSSGRVGKTRIEVTPACRGTDAMDQALCACQCEKGYTLGKCSML